jgi:hypothetical protein
VLRPNVIQWCQIPVHHVFLRYNNFNVSYMYRKVCRQLKKKTHVVFFGAETQVSLPRDVNRCFSDIFAGFNIEVAKSVSNMLEL